MTESEIQQLNAQIVEAKAALHALMLGQAAAVIVNRNGERVEYTQASRRDLASYIATLEQQLLNGGALLRISQPAGVIF